MSETKKNNMMIIDAHNHADWQGHNLARFLENMRKYNIDKTCLLTRECPDNEIPHSAILHYTPGVPGLGQLPLSRCISYVERAPDKFIIGYAPDPRRPEAIDQLEAAINIYGVRIYGELKLRMMYDNPDAVRMFHFCGKKKIPVLVHIECGIDLGVKYPRPDYWYGGGIDAFERALKQCPDTIFIGHGPGFWAHFSADDQYKTQAYPKGEVLPGGQVMELLEHYGNLFCDLSAFSGCNALLRDFERGKKFLLEFQDRILYARDCFDNRLQELLKTFDLPLDVISKIYSRNALKLVNESEHIK